MKFLRNNRLPKSFFNGKVCEEKVLVENLTAPKNIESSAKKIAMRAIERSKHLRQVVQTNSLESGGIPLCFHSQESVFFNRTEAVFCDKEKTWFCPIGRGVNFEEFAPYFPKAFRGGNNILVPNLVPQLLWGENLRKGLSRGDWDFLSMHTYARFGRRCAICGGREKKWPVECHEVWEYRPFDEKSGIALLKELRSLCSLCHRVNHLGKARVDGLYQKTLVYMAEINGWSIGQAQSVAKKAFDLWERLSKKQWAVGYDDEEPWDPSIKAVLDKLFLQRKI